MLDNVKRIVVVLSGKGGVGKSTVSTQLALTLREHGLKVGLLDIDLCGPSVPHMLNLEDESIRQNEAGWVPVYMGEENRLAVMSIAYMLKKRSDAVVWRGPKKTSLIRQFLHDVDWQELDYLVIDTPPGTSDEHITVMENIRSLPNCGALLVSTPQQVAIEDVRKEISFCRRSGVRLLGLIENMSGYECPTCSECTNIFSTGGVESLAEITNIPYLGSAPIDPRVGRLAGQGKAVVTELPESTTAKLFEKLVKNVQEAFENGDVKEIVNKQE